MRAYTITTGLIFLAVTGAHVLRMVAEPDLARESWYYHSLYPPPCSRAACPPSFRHKPCAVDIWNAPPEQG